ncbi:hypothetical protein BP5796_04170 [Coleophoma crateriformis]|uniref:VWFA domain-containing protein n=1 Tax=Coleophoma crateriformis TaxID=565419 RepID=A0A3D8SHM0_9HELO|nr:hypothetical protein BP5796_04170 [Coleophoma crateriformis]
MQHAIPTSSAWSFAHLDETMPSRRSSVFGSLRKLGRKNSNSSTRTISTALSTEQHTPRSLRVETATSNTVGRSPSPSPFGANPSPATRRPGNFTLVRATRSMLTITDRPGMNAFTVPSNEPPPAYTASPSPSPLSPAPVELPSPVPAPNYTVQPAGSGEDPYIFLETFDTTLLIDDSGSMAGRSWREVSQALSIIAPIITQHDSDGMDCYFLNHKSTDSGAPSEGAAPGGYRKIRRAETITEIFERVRPQGGTPTGIRIHHILKPYLAKLEIEVAAGREMKPLNLIVLTDGVPSDDVESVLLSAAKKLDRLDAPPFQIGVQFFQVGNEEGAKEALQELDDDLSELVEGGVRDMVDTVTWTGGAAASEGGVGLTGEGILKALLGAVVRRLDRKRASGEVPRSQAQAS